MQLVIYDLGGGHTHRHTHTYFGGTKVISRNQAHASLRAPGLKMAVTIIHGVGLNNKNMSTVKA